MGKGLQSFSANWFLCDLVSSNLAYTGDPGAQRVGWLVKIIKEGSKPLAIFQRGTLGTEVHRVGDSDSSVWFAQRPSVSRHADPRAGPQKLKLPSSSPQAKVGWREFSP